VAGYKKKWMAVEVVVAVAMEVLAAETTGVAKDVLDLRKLVAEVEGLL